MVAADFNHDSRLDLAAAIYEDNAPSPRISVLLGNGNGTFQASRISESGLIDGLYVTYADLNRDGNTDLAVTSDSLNGASVLLGKGDGTFQPPVVYATGNRPISLGVTPLDNEYSTLYMIDAYTGRVLVTVVTPDGRLSAPVGRTAEFHRCCKLEWRREARCSGLRYGVRSRGCIAGSPTGFQAPTVYRIPDSVGSSATAQALAARDLNGENPKARVWPFLDGFPSPLPCLGGPDLLRNSGYRLKQANVSVARFWAPR